MTGTWRLARVHCRTAWPLLVGPALLLAALVIATASGVRGLYPTAAERAVYAATMGASPAGWAFNGRGVDVATIGGIAAYEVGFMGQLLVPVIGLMIGIGLTRRLEEAGVTELVTACRVGRTAPVGAALVVGTGSWLLFAKVVEAGLFAVGFDRPGVSAYPAILALYGIAFTGIGLLAGQLAQGTRGAFTLGAVAVVAGFVARAYVDGRQLTATWISPMGWVAEAHPWGTWVWWPALAFLALTALSAGAAIAVAARRDLFSGVLPQRSGPAVASPRLATPAGLAWRLTRGLTAAWTAGAVIWCASIGLMAQEMTLIIRANPTLAQALGDDPGRVVSVLSLVITGVLAGAAGVSAMSRLGAEELDARLGLVLAGALSRARLWLSWSLVAGAGALTTLFCGAAALGAAQWLAAGTGPGGLCDAGPALRELESATAYAAPVLFLTAAAGLLIALGPRLRGLAWLPVGWCAIVGLMAQALGLPDWSRRLSPFELVGRVPVVSADPGAWAWLIAAAFGALTLATLRFRARSLARG